METRRDLLKGALAMTPVWAQKKNRTRYAYVGCYITAQRHGRGDGIHVYRLDGDTGEWSHVQHVGNLVNPSFLVASRDGRFLYSVHGDENYATAFAIDGQTGTLRILNQAATGGRNGVHQAIDPSGRFMVVANYATGTVAVLPVRRDGDLKIRFTFSLSKESPGRTKLNRPAPILTTWFSIHPGVLSSCRTRGWIASSFFVSTRRAAG